MTPILERVQECLTANDLKFVPHEDGRGLVVIMSLRHCRCHIVFLHEPDGEYLTLQALHPTAVPPERRPAVAEFITRLNWNLSDCRFLMDWSDGEVRLRQDILVKQPPALEDLELWFASTCVLLDGFYPALMNVVYRGMLPVQALEQGEADFAALVRSHKRKDGEGDASGEPNATGEAAEGGEGGETGGA